MRALEAECEVLVNEDHSEALAADSPVAIYSLLGMTRMKGQLYRTKEKKILVLVFVKVISQCPPVFGRKLIASTGTADSTFTVECMRSCNVGLTVVRSRIDKHGAADGSKHHGAFIESVSRECGLQVMLCSNDA